MASSIWATVLTILFGSLTFSVAEHSSPSETATQNIQSIVNDITSWQKEHSKTSPSRARPFVTVTYAQSLDGKIALLARDDKDASTSSNFAISDPESLRMTHALRSIHDAILVGGKTLSVDNPRLSNRLWDVKNQPRPVVLDTHLKHMKALGNACRARNVLVCCSHDVAVAEDVRKNLPDFVELLPCPVDSETGSIDLDYLLQQLKANYNIESIMLEGGASVLTAFYGRPELVDCLCITISPKLLLWNGLPAINTKSIVGKGGRGDFILDTADFDCSKFLTLGKDSIFLGNLIQ